MFTAAQWKELVAAAAVGAGATTGTGKRRRRGKGQTQTQADSSTISSLLLSSFSADRLLASLHLTRTSYTTATAKLINCFQIPQLA